MSFWEKADLGAAHPHAAGAERRADEGRAGRRATAGRRRRGRGRRPIVAGEETAQLRAANAQDERRRVRRQVAALDHAPGASRPSSAAATTATRRSSTGSPTACMSGPLLPLRRPRHAGGAEQLAASRLQREYEIDTMKRQAAELACGAAPGDARAPGGPGARAAAQASAQRRERPRRTARSELRRRVRPAAVHARRLEHAGRADEPALAALPRHGARRRQAHAAGVQLRERRRPRR